MRWNQSTVAAAVIASSSIGVGGLAAAPVVIDTTTAVITIPTPAPDQLLNIDLNGDGQGDLEFNIFTLVPEAVIAQVGVIRQGRGISDSFDPTFPNLELFPELGAPVVLEVAPGASVRTAVDVLPVSAPDQAVIGSAGAYVDYPALGESQPVFNGGPVVNRSFFLGYRFLAFDAVNAPSHYGWIRVRLQWDGPGPGVEQWSILAAAYESTPDTDIAAGALPPACPADFNQSGAISVQDIFDFLAAYFGNATNADFNQSGEISVQDIFDYLAAYFTGC